MLNPTSRFQSLVTKSGSDIDLDRGALLIAAHARPDLDLDFELSRLDHLARRCRSRSASGLLSYLFEECGFLGDKDNYYDAENSFLDRVLDRRRGIPITLAVVAIEVGKRIGIKLRGVGMPGHFLLADDTPGSDRWYDAFAGGRALDLAGCEELFRVVHGPAVPFDRTLLDAVDPRSILARILANLRHIFSEQGRSDQLAWVLRLRSMIPGISAAELTELAQTEASLGRMEEAAEALDHLAERLGGEVGANARRQAHRLRAKLN